MSTRKNQAQKKNSQVNEKSDVSEELQLQNGVAAPEIKQFASFTGDDGNQYAIVIPKLSIKKKVYSAQEIADDEALREELVAQAWQGQFGKLEEAEFDKNGIFRIVY